MATVEVIREEVKPTKPPIKEVVLRMSNLEAQIVRAAMRRIGGLGYIRSAVNAIEKALAAAEIEAPDSEQTGQLLSGSLYTTEK